MKEACTFLISCYDTSTSSSQWDGQNPLYLVFCHSDPHPLQIVTFEVIHVQSFILHLRFARNLLFTVRVETIFSES